MLVLAATATMTEAAPVESTPERPESGRGIVTLPDLRARALKQRPELVVDRTRIAQAEAQESIASAGRMPTIAATLDTSVSPGGQLIELSPGVSGLDGPVLVQGSPTIDQGAAAFEPNVRYGGLIGVDWKIYDFGRTDALLRAARAETGAKKAEAARTKSNLLAAVDAAYLEWLGASERARFERAALDRLHARRRDLEARVQVGALAPSMLLALDAELASAELRVAYADDGIQRIHASVEAAIGQSLEPDARPDPLLLEIAAPDLDPSDANAASDAASRADAAGQMLSAQREALEAHLEAYSRSWRPVLRLSAQAGLRGQATNLFPVYQGSVGLTFPLWDGNQSGSRLALARAQRLEIDARITQHIDARRQAIHESQQTIHRSTKRLALAQTFLERARARLVDAEQRQLEGTASDQDVTSAREQTTRAAVEVLTAQLDRASAILSLDR